MTSGPVILIPGDDPPQIQETPHLERLKDHGDVRLYVTRPQSRAEKLDRAADADIIVNTRGLVGWDAEDFASLPKLKMLTTCSIGTDMFDLAAAKAYRKVICNVPLATVPMVAEHLFGLVLAVAKQAAFQTVEIKAGRWLKPFNVYLAGKTLGIVGTGNIGSEVARLARAIGMNVVAWTFNPSPSRAAELGVTFVTLDELLQRSDVVSLNVRLMPDTEGLIGARELAMMKEDAILVNGARGKVLDMEALCDALEAGRLYGVGLDVFPEEPVPAGARILGFDRVVLTPHAADQTPEAIDAVNAGAVDNVIAFLEGRPQNVVNR
ncbi:MAG: NAD(P)-dependent oxidoreductase [Kiloniellales bacterium]|nr:NAD(P)-dependent oxidoreductase [Kiloniellales bacterium]